MPRAHWHLRMISGWQQTLDGVHLTMIPGWRRALNHGVHITNLPKLKFGVAISRFMFTFVLWGTGIWQSREFSYLIGAVYRSGIEYIPLTRQPRVVDHPCDNYQWQMLPISMVSYSQPMAGRHPLEIGACVLACNWLRSGSYRGSTFSCLSLSLRIGILCAGTCSPGVHTFSYPFVC